MTLRLHDISKQFGRATALDRVTLDLAAGEVHALLGENGAGKTTLTRIAYGMIRPDSGTITVNDRQGIQHESASLDSPAAARAYGIGMVHQHFTSIPALTVSENIALTAGWRETGRRAERRAADVVAQLGLPLNVSARAETLSVQLRQRLEIVKVLAAEAKILLLDEPTAVLAPREVSELLLFIRAFADQGGAVLLITHKLAEVFRVTDRVTVLRRGVVILSDALAGQTPQSLAHAMIGGDPVPAPARVPATPGDVVVRAAALQLGRGGRVAVSNATLEVRAGEILGVAAIEGNGQRELLRAIARVDDVEVRAGTLDVEEPIAFIPEDRSTEGLIGEFSLAENFLLGTIGNAPAWIDWGAIGERTRTVMSENDVRAVGSGAAAASLSGGNQQKFILGRALQLHPRVLVAEDPTRGLDVHATAEVHRKLREAANGGAAVVVHSSDLDEVMLVADRVLVMAHGVLREMHPGASREEVGDAMLDLAASR